MKCVVLRPEGGCGICGYIWQVIRGIYHNPNKTYHVDFSTCIYKDSAVQNINNVWEYYFIQPHTNSLSVIEPEKTVGLIDVPESEFRDVYMVNPTPEYIKEMRYKFNNIIKSNIILKDHIKQKIEDYIDIKFKGKKILGLHLRGTDHPDKKPVQEYMQTVKTKLKDYDFLFVCSDEQYNIDFCKVVFGGKVITYNSKRSESSQPLHHRPNTSNHHYKIGEDVIVEAYLMANTDFLLCGTNSNVNYLSRAINPELESLVMC
jgi:hypothetical protein